MGSGSFFRMDKVLHLTLKKKQFDEILSGDKIIEYREIKPYWTKRLLDSHGESVKYDVIYFRNGYSKDCRKMKVEFKGLKIGEEYEILLGRVLWSGV